MMTSNGKRIVFVSDLHLGHNRTHASSIHANLQKYLYPELTKDTDLLVLGGDILDQLISFDSSAAVEVHCIITELTELAQENKFYIRAVRGTFKHDRNQLRHLLVQSHLRQLKLHGAPLVDIKEETSVEHIKPLDLTIGYLPDDLPVDNGAILLKEVMENNKVRVCDFIIRHGYFEHLLPDGIPSAPRGTLSAEQIRPLVKHLVLNGHVHTPSVYKFIISAGSFDRLAHGEEEPKGFFVIELKDDKIHHRFIENEGAQIYKKIHVKDLNESSLSKIEKTLSLYIPTEGLIYVEFCIQNHGFKGTLKALGSLLLKNAIFTFSSPKDKKHMVEVSHLDLAAASNIIVNIDQAPKMLSKYIGEHLKADLSDKTIQEHLTHLETLYANTSRKKRTRA